MLLKILLNLTYNKSGMAVVHCEYSINRGKLKMARERKILPCSSKVYSTALYRRLSKEDGDKDESDSILNQGRMLESYIENKLEFKLYDVYTDDGYTGTNFERPDFKRMIQDIKDKKIDCVIVKDLSRFGRTYIDSGNYIERFFPDNDIRFIAINDSYDSLYDRPDFFLSVKNIFNEQYARDISKKVQSSFKVKQKSGEFCGAFASYGYMKSAADKHKLIVDEYAAGIVRQIFKLYIEGKGKLGIAKYLNQREILCPSEYKKRMGQNYRNNNRLENTAYWTYSTVNRILQNEMYIGNMVQNKTYRRMNGKAKYRPREEWIIVKNTHPPIIDMHTWQQVQNLLGRETKHLDFNQNISIFAGFLKCGDCGRALSKTVFKDNVFYTCAAYKRYGKKICTPHTIEYKILAEIILKDLQTCINSIKNIQEIIQSQKDLTRQGLDSKKSEREKTRSSLEKVRILKKRSYEDYVEGIITKDEYMRYRTDYQKKEKLYQDKLDLLKQNSNEQSDELIHSPWAVKLLKYQNIIELDRQIIVEMVNFIEVFQDNHIEITYNFSDEFDTLFEKYYCNVIS